MERYIEQLLEELAEIALNQWKKDPPFFYRVGANEKYFEPPTAFLDFVKTVPKNYFDKEEEPIDHDEVIAILKRGGVSKYTMLEHFDLKVEAFPPVERLTEKQLEELNTGIRRLWASFNFRAELSKKWPNHLVYTSLVKEMAKPAQLLALFGTVDVNFCDYNPNTCPVDAKYCVCKDLDL